MAAAVARVRERIAEAGGDPGSVGLVAVTKRQPVEAVEAVIAAGVRDVSRLDATLASLAEELSAQYVLGYTPKTAAAAREWRRVSVTVDRRHVSVRTRQGYWTR